MRASARAYFRLSRTYWYSLIFILPLVVLYETLALFINWNTPVHLRNGADVLLRLLLELFGLSTPYISGAVLAVVVVGAWLWHRQRYGAGRVAGGYLMAMLAESLFWALFLLVVLVAADQLLLIDPSDRVLTTAFLAIGAGIYEEGVFRLLAISVLVAFFQGVMHWQRYLAWVAAVGVAAVLFALFHYVGSVGEPFAWNSFGYRTVAGVALGVLFSLRGFGITVYTHTFYDLTVLGIRTLGL